MEPTPTQPVALTPWTKATMSSLAEATILLSTALVVNYYASSFATESASNFVTDIVLDNVRTYDVDGIFIYGSIAFWIFVGFLLLLRIRLAPFVLKSISLFILIRAISITLTHIAPFPGQLNIPEDSFIHFFTFGGDLFFSGHTGLPFLLGLLFWREPLLRSLFLVTSVVFACVVLLGHYHYSIDVFAAFFITPTIAQIARFFFRKDYEVFQATQKLRTW